MATDSKTHKKADQYNDPTHNYLHYWEGRDYENDAEVIAIKRFLKGKRFKNAVDIGGGYGRLCVLLSEYADKVTLAEPSQQQLDIAEGFLKDYPQIDRQLMQADDLRFETGSVDLIMMIRVMHHLPDPRAEFAEINRALSDDGYFLLEIANNADGLNRLKLALKGKRIPAEPVDIRSAEHRTDAEIAFVNHNPKTVIKQLAHAGFKVEKIQSVSNLRSPVLKKVLPRKLMLALENVMQPTLAKTFFGPSTFLLIRKAK
jgi:SAM-dependent methyltransferase